jgi:hypothetical protein
MKQKTLSLFIFLLVLAGFFLTQSCEKSECPECQEEPEPELHTLFDTLQGAWTWIYTSNYFSDEVPPYYPITVHFLSENTDSSINYVTFKHDTIKKHGRFTVQSHVWGRRIDPDILVHYNKFWDLIFDFVSKDTIRFYDYSSSPDYHYYKKIEPK